MYMDKGSDVDVSVAVDSDIRPVHIPTIHKLRTSKSKFLGEISMDLGIPSLKIKKSDWVKTLKFHIPGRISWVGCLYIWGFTP